MSKLKQPKKYTSLVAVDKQAKEDALDRLFSTGMLEPMARPSSEEQQVDEREKKPVNKRQVLKNKRSRSQNRTFCSRSTSNASSLGSLPSSPEQVSNVSYSSGPMISSSSTPPEVPSPTPTRQQDLPSAAYPFSPYRSREFRRSHSISPLALKELENRFPTTKFVFGTGNTHPHVVGATERAICESLVYEKIMSQFPSGVRVTDIGGNPVRHMFSHRSNIHCCNPLLDSNDVRRAKDRAHCKLNEYQTGQHTVQQCELHADVFMSIHSLYYLTQDDILALVVRSQQENLPGLYAVVHTFDGFAGQTHFNGVEYESAYEVHSPESVSMTVIGNDSGYTHDPLFWLGIGKTNSKYYASWGRAMVWAAEKFGDSYIVRFWRSPLLKRVPDMLPVSFAESLRDTNYRGPVQLVKGTEDSQRPLYNFLKIEKIKIYSVFSSFFTFSDGSGYTVVPKGAVSTIAMAIVGMERNKDTYQRCLREAKNTMHSKKVKMNEEVRTRSVIYCAALAFIYHIGDEMNALLNVLQPANVRMYNRLGRMLRFDFEPFSCFCGTKHILEEDPAIAVRTRYNLFHECARLRQNVNMDKVFPNGTMQHTADNVLKNLDPEVMVHSAPDQGTPPKEDKGIYPILPSIQGHIPVVVASNAENETLAVRNRIANEKVVEDPDVWSSLITSSKKWAVYENWWENQLMPLPLAEELWLKTIDSPTKREIYTQGLASLADKGWVKQNERILAFCKREKQNKTLANQIELFTPRLVQGHTPEFNAALGPFAWQTANNMKNVWDGKGVLYFCSGATAEDVGSWFTRNRSEGTTYVECDFSEYDSTQQEGAFKLAQAHYKMAGLQQYPNAEKAFLASKHRFAVTNHGVAFSYKYQCASGSQDTTVRNSLTDGITIRAGLHHCGFSDRDLKIAVLGDDSLSMIRSGVTFNQGHADKLQSYLTSLGLRPKIKFSTTIAHVEFCSAIFWPVVATGGKFGPVDYLPGPKPGKYLSKTGWCMRRLDDDGVKGMLLGQRISVNHVPLLSTYVAHCLSKYTKGDTNPKFDPEDKYKIRCGSTHQMKRLEAALMFEERYGLDLPAMTQQLQEKLDSCGVHDAFDWEEFESMYLIDN